VSGCVCPKRQGSREWTGNQCEIHSCPFCLDPFSACTTSHDTMRARCGLRLLRTRCNKVGPHVDEAPRCLPPAFSPWSRPGRCAAGGFSTSGRTLVTDAELREHRAYVTKARNGATPGPPSRARAPADRQERHLSGSGSHRRVLEPRCQRTPRSSKTHCFFIRPGRGARSRRAGSSKRTRDLDVLYISRSRRSTNRMTGRGQLRAHPVGPAVVLQRSPARPPPDGSHKCSLIALAG